MNTLTNSICPFAPEWELQRCIKYSIMKATTPNAYIRKLINVRHKINEAQLGRRDMSVMQDFDFIKRYFEAFNYKGDKAIRFMMKHKSKFYNIMPGGNQHSFYKEAFENLTEKENVYANPK